ncbi:MAG: PAS domain S-box protein [Elusimicrobia bacterium]|nr:PAS domain S-box protein [Elusimicrobiota bacterium]
MTIFALFSLAGSLISLCLACYVFYKNPRDKVNRLFSLVCLSIAYWGFAEFMIRRADSESIAYQWIRLNCLWPYTAALLFHFTLLFTQSRLVRNRVLFIALYGISTFFAVLDGGTNLVSSKAVKEYWGYTYDYVYKWPFWIGNSWAYITVLISLYLLIAYYFSVKDSGMKMKAKYMAIGFAIPAFSNVITEGLLRIIDVKMPEMTVISMAWLLIFVAYAINKYELFSVTAEMAIDNIIDNVPDIFMILNLKGIIVKTNSDILRISRFKEEEMLGRPINDFLHTPMYEYPGLKGKDRVIKKSIEFKSKLGGYLNLDVTASAIYGKRKKVVGFLVLGKDTTELNQAREKERRLLKDLERSNKDLEQFAYITSHDLQEPLRMVTSYLGLVERRYKEKLDADGREFIDFATGGAMRMQRMINDLLTYSRVTSKKAPFTDTDLRKALEKALMNLKVLIKEKEAEVTYDSLPVLRADEIQVIQLFQNLVNNAVKFSAGRTPRIHISAVRKDSNWNISVKDNGIGIAKNDLNRIFDIFTRIYGGREYEGTGIGLAVCKKIVENHGGEIWAQSVPGEGSVFSFTLPAAGD